MSIHDIITSRGLKTSSAKCYIQRLTKLEKDYGMPLLQALAEDSELTTFNKIFEGKSVHTKKTYLTAIHSLVCGIRHGNGNIDDCHPTSAPFHREMNKINDGIIEWDKHQSKTKKQEENWCTLDELKGLMTKYHTDCAGYIKDDNLTMKHLIEIQKHLIMSLYLGDEANPPIRSEYGDMIVVFKKDKVKQDKHENYLLVNGPRSKYFILNNYKTNKTTGSLKFKVGKVLNKVLNDWLGAVGHMSGDPLLLKPTGGMLGRNGLSKMLLNITNPLGKRISVQLLRHIFISENIIMPKLEEKKAIADKMCHSTGQQEMYKKY